MSRDAHTAFSRAVVDEWVRGGVAHACVAPGSRSTPMAHALAVDGRIAVHVFLDEMRRFYEIERLYRDRPRVEWRLESPTDA